jgi:hypothetical protein
MSLNHEHILLSHIRDSPNLEGQVLVFIFPTNRMAQIYPQALGSFYASYMSQVCGRVIPTNLHSYAQTSYSHVACRVENTASSNFSFVSWLFITVPLPSKGQLFLKLKFIFDRQSDGQSVLVGRRPSGTRGQFFFRLEISFRQLRVCYFVAPSLRRGRVCNLLYSCFWAFAIPAFIRTYLFFAPGRTYKSRHNAYTVKFLRFLLSASPKQNRNVCSTRSR